MARQTTNVSLQKQEVLLDGAHNPQAARLLGEYIDVSMRNEPSNNHITFILGFSEGKNVSEIVQEFVRSGDTVITTGFSAVEGMPWVKSETHENILKGLQGLENVDIVDAGDSSCVGKGCWARHSYCCVRQFVLGR